MLTLVVTIVVNNLENLIVTFVGLIKNKTIEFVKKFTMEKFV